MTTPPRQPSPATAGMLLLTTFLLGTGAGAGIGALVGAVGPLMIVGVFVGFFLGIAVVRSRFRDL